MMTAAEYSQVLHTFNDTGVPPATPTAAGALVHHQFMRRAAEQPDAPCLIYQGHALTYQQVRHTGHMCTVQADAASDIRIGRPSRL